MAVTVSELKRWLSTLDETELVWINDDGLALETAGTAYWEVGGAPNDEQHRTDSDCTLGDDDTCTVCGVYHANPCAWCGGRGFHNPGCSEVQS